MRPAAIAVVAIALVAPAGAEAADALKVVSSSVRVERATRAEVKVRCRQSHPCRGVLVLHVRCDQGDQPVVDQNCILPVGTADFVIPGRRVRTVSVRRNGVRFTSASADAAVVRALPYLKTRSGSRVSGSRQLTLVGSPSQPRPAVNPDLVDLDAYSAAGDTDAYNLALQVDVPRGSISARAGVGSRRVGLHPAGAQPYTVAGGSWLPGGVVFHGVLRTTADELPPHSRQAVSVTGCQVVGGCRTTTTSVVLPGPNDPRPICHIGLGPVSAPARLLAGLPR